MDLLTLIPVIVTLGSIATFTAKLVVLVWVFYKSKRFAAIAYLGFLVIDLFVYRSLTGLLFNSLLNGQTIANSRMKW